MTRAYEAPAVTTPGDGATFPAFVVDATGETDVDAAWSRALDGSRDDVFEEMAMLEGAFAQTLSDL